MRNTTKVLLTIALTFTGTIPRLARRDNNLSNLAGIAGVCMAVSVARSVYQAAADNRRAAACE